MHLFVKSFLILLCFVAVMHTVHGQYVSYAYDESSEDEEVPEKYFIRLGITPTSFFNDYAGLQVNSSIVFSDRFHLTTEGCWIFYTLTSDEFSIRGYRLRPALRYYLNPSADIKTHFSIGYNYRKTTSQRLAEFITGAYKNPITRFQQRRVLQGPVLMAGFEFFTSEVVLMDMGIGFGRGTLEVTDHNGPDGQRIYADYIEYDQPGNYDFTLFIINFRVQHLF